MKLRTINEINVRGKYVLLREDFNVQIVDGKITDDFRITQSMPTITALRDAGARIVMVSHLGRPNGNRDMAYSLAPVAKYMNVPLIDDCLDKAFLSQMKDGDIALLENVRFYPGEEENDSVFAQKLSEGFDLFVNDAFAVSHRAHASTVGVAQYLPSYAGKLLASEIEHLDAVMDNPAHPFVAIVAGSKISTKLGVLRALAKIADKLIIGGALGTTFNYALGAKVGNSLYESDQKDAVLDLLSWAKSNDCEVLIPLDKGVATEFLRDAKRMDKTFDEINDNDIILDAGALTTARDVDVIKNASTVVWNGTVGMAEWIPTWSEGSFALARAIAERTRAGKLKSVVGGGDTVACLEACGVKDDISYVSTGGGAFLEYIEGRKLPGIMVLVEK